ncbi:hypothetical protein ABW19_dt0210270 [Dactylella cylindrospora]|nr:hypothetical protein ABW19_dt0210270 [Dactylella cylindrospora]
MQLDSLEQAWQEELREVDEMVKNASPMILQMRGLACLNLRVSRYYTGLGGKSILELEPDRAINARSGIASHGIRSGDLVRVEEQVPTSTKKVERREIREKAVTGVVIRAGEQMVSIALDKLGDAFDLSKRIWIMKLSSNVPFKRMVRAITDLRNKSHEDLSDLVRIAFGLASMPAPSAPDHELKYFNEHLNQSQKEAISFALNQTLALVHGPPGTGKTHTLIEIIRQLVAKGCKVLVCGPSNVSVDNIVERLAPYKIPMVRVGHPARLMQSVLTNSLDFMIQNSDTGMLVRDIRREMDEKLASTKKARASKDRKAIWNDIRSLRKECKERERRCIRDILKSSQVVLSTLHGAGGSQIRTEHFDVVVIDEASQALEAQCWIPMLEVKKCILAGDHLQLPPTIKASRNSLEFQNLELSLFERVLRLHGNGIKRMLLTQYRMHETIMQYPSKALYDSSLIAAEGVKGHLLSQLAGVGKDDDTTEPLVFWDTQGGAFGESASAHEAKSTSREAGVDHSKSNAMEAGETLLPIVSREHGLYSINSH